MLWYFWVKWQENKQGKAFQKKKNTIYLLPWKLKVAEGQPSLDPENQRSQKWVG